MISAIRNRKKGRVGRPSIDAKIVNDALVPVLAQHRQTLRHASAATGFSISTLLRVLKRGEIRRVRNNMKPFLTEENKLDRVRWALFMICGQTLVFASMQDYFVFDEKWFYMSKITRTFYLGKDELEPECSGKSSRYTPKVMFLAAIARPRLDDDGECVFVGKIGFCPFIEMVAAQRNSMNRPDGTLEPNSVSE